MTTVILKPTDGCNARCRYCSAAHPGEARKMTPGTLEEVLDLFGGWALEQGPRDLKFIWHGGEPLLMPESFWEAVFRGQDRLQRRGLRIVNGIQTNATLIRPASIPFLKHLLGERGAVGTSADPLPGFRELKGAPDGRYAEVLAASLGLLREAGLRYGILFVVHRQALDSLPEIYRTFRDQHPDAGLRFNPLYRQGRATDAGTWEDLGITAGNGARLSSPCTGPGTRTVAPRMSTPSGPGSACRRGGSGSFPVRVPGTVRPATSAWTRMVRSTSAAGRPTASPSGSDRPGN